MEPLMTPLHKLKIVCWTLDYYNTDKTICVTSLMQTTIVPCVTKYKLDSNLSISETFTKLSVLSEVIRIYHECYDCKLMTSTECIHMLRLLQ